MTPRLIAVCLLLATTLAACGEPDTPTLPAPTATVAAIATVAATATIAPVATATQPAVPTTAPTVAPTTAPTATILAPTATATPTTVLNTSDLLQALALVPTGAGNVAFTDWALIKQYANVPDLNSSAPADQRAAFMLTLNKDQAAASGYAIEHFTDHAAVWGWDSTDLAWEASIEGNKVPPVWLLKFRSGSDFAPIVARFEQRGFTRDSYAGAPIYTHNIDLHNDWLNATEFAILNTAVLSDSSLLVLSAAPEGVHAVLDARRRSGGPGTLAADDSTRAVANALGPVIAAAYILPGAAGCTVSGFDTAVRGTPRAGQDADQLQAIRDAMLQNGAALHAYDGMGIAYRIDSGLPLGLAAFHYTGIADADADLAPRRTLATQGISMATNRPYRDDLFTLEGVTSDSGDLLLRLRPANDQPSRLFRMIFQHDMAFAACPGS